MVWSYRVVEHRVWNEQEVHSPYYAIHEVSFDVSSEVIAQAGDVEQLLMAHLAGYASPSEIHGPSLVTIKSLLQSMEAALTRPSRLHRQLDTHRDGHHVVHYEEWDNELRRHYLLYEPRYEDALQTWLARPFDPDDTTIFAPVPYLQAESREGLRWHLDEMLAALELPVLPTSLFDSRRRV